jgi:hypothetical protein
VGFQRKRPTTDGTRMRELEQEVNSDLGRTSSPELVLVDPELAARARASLAIHPAPPRSVTPVRSSQLAEDESLEAPPPAAKKQHGPTRWPGRRSWPLMAGTAAAIVATLLLLDVRVEVGKSPASAEPATLDLPPPALPSLPPISPTQPASTSEPRSATKPPSSPKLEPRRFAWAPVQGATAYRIEIRRGSMLIFARETTRPEIEIPRAWKRAGVTQTLRPGEYRWYVWPIVSERRSTKAVVQASLSIPE